MRATATATSEPTLADLLAELHAIRALLEARRRPPPSRDDHDRLAPYCPRLVARSGPSGFWCGSYFCLRRRPCGWCCAD